MIQKLKDIATGLLGISGVILIHELGHFLACKLCGVATPVFSIGFNPAIFSFRFWKTTFQIGLLPLGGYVSIDPYSFAYVSLAKKLFIISAGIAANFLFTAFIFWYLAQKDYEPHSENTDSEDQENEQTDHSKQVKSKQNRFIGPIGIISLIAQSAHQGVDAFLYLLGIISLNVGIFNILPFPPFDGGQAVVVIWQALMGNSFESGFGDMIYPLILLLLIVFSIIIAVRDLRQLFK